MITEFKRKYNIQILLNIRKSCWNDSIHVGMINTVEVIYTVEVSPFLSLILIT